MSCVVKLSCLSAERCAHLEECTKPSTCGMCFDQRSQQRQNSGRGQHLHQSTSQFPVGAESRVGYGDTLPICRNDAYRSKLGVLWAVPMACCLSWAHTYCALIPVNLGQNGEAGLAEGTVTRSFSQSCFVGLEEQFSSRVCPQHSGGPGFHPRTTKKGGKKEDYYHHLGDS